MITDVLNTFADNLALNTGGAGTYVVGDQINLGVASRNIGVAPGLAELYLVIKATTQFDSAGGAATATFQLVTAENAALTTNPVVLATTSAIAELTGAPGVYLWVIPLPFGGVTYKQYIGIRQVTAGEAFTAGAFDAFLTQYPPYRYDYAQATGASLA